MMALAAMMVSSCDSKKAVAVDALNGEWDVVAIDGQKVDAEELPYIGFDIKEKRVYGFAGCNRIMGTFDTDSLNPGTITLSDMAATKMMCPDMTIEDNLLKAISAVAGYSTIGNGFTLTDASGKALISLVKRVLPVATIGDLNGKWIMKSVKGITLEGLEDVPFIEFSVADHKVHGNAGCNLVNGEFAQEEGNAASLKFDQMATTMKACPDMDKETAILSAMNMVRGFQLEDGLLVLQDEKGEALITLSK